MFSVCLQDAKFSTLCDLYDTVCVNKAVIFCNSRRKVEQLTREMDENDFTISCIVSYQSEHCFL